MTHHDPINPRGLHHADNEADCAGSICDICGGLDGHHETACPDFHDLADADADYLEWLVAEALSLGVTDE